MQEEKSNGHSATYSGLFQARDATPIYYHVGGNPEGRPLIFCYGLTCRRDHWRHQIAWFERRYRIVTFDYRGHNASAYPPNDRHLTIDWLAKDIEDLSNHLNLREAVGLGHSMGVSVLTQAAPLLKERMRGLVFVCGAVNNPFDHMFYTDQLNAVYRASAFLFDRFPDAAARVWSGFTRKNPISYFLTSQFGFNPDTADEQDIDSYLEGVHRTPLKVFHALLRDYTRYDGRPHLQKIHCPTLVVAGEDDCITPLRVTKEMCGLIPKGELATIADGSHNAHSDFPDEVNRRIEHFLAGIGYE